MLESSEVPQFLIRELTYTPEKSRLRVKAQLHTTTMIPREVLEKSVPSIVGKEVRLMHTSPEEDVEKGYLGTVERYFWQDEQPFVEFVVDGKTKTQKYVQDILWNERDTDRSSKKLPDISAGIISTEDSDGNMVDAFFREVSIVDEGACVDCYIRSVERFGKASQGAGKGEMNMSADKDSGKSGVGAEERKVIEENAVIVRYQKDLAERDETIKTTMGMLDKVRSDITDLTAKLENNMAENKELKEKISHGETLAMRTEIVTNRGYKPGSEEFVKRVEFYKGFPRAALEGLVEDDKRQQEQEKAGLTNKNEHGVQFDTYSKSSIVEPGTPVNTTSDEPKKLSQMEYRVGQTQKDKYEIEYPLGPFKLGSG